MASSIRRGSCARAEGPLPLARCKRQRFGFRGTRRRRHGCPQASYVRTSDAAVETPVGTGGIAGIEPLSAAESGIGPGTQSRSL